jgi:hypothetical protein
MKSPVQTLSRWSIAGVDDHGTPTTKRVELSVNSDATYGVRLVVGGELIDEEWFIDLFDAREYANEMRQTVTEQSHDGESGEHPIVVWPIVDFAAKKRSLEAVANAVRTGRVDDVRRALETAGRA